jgi:hypothetical protein
VQRFDRDDDKRAATVGRALGERAPGLVYVATRRDAERYAEALTERGLVAAAYHAGLRAAERTRTHQRFTGDELDVVEATSAFGMGIDKPNVRFVLHAAIPDSLDSYHQEIGRAGRDGEPANAILLYRPEDHGLQRFHAGGAPDDQALTRLPPPIPARLLRRGTGPALWPLRHLPGGHRPQAAAGPWQGRLPRGQPGGASRARPRRGDAAGKRPPHRAVRPGRLQDALAGDRPAPQTADQGMSRQTTSATASANWAA